MVTLCANVMPEAAMVAAPIAPASRRLPRSSVIHFLPLFSGQVTGALSPGQQLWPVHFAGFPFSVNPFCAKVCAMAGRVVPALFGVALSIYGAGVAQALAQAQNARKVIR